MNTPALLQRTRTCINQGAQATFCSGFCKALELKLPVCSAAVSLGAGFFCNFTCQHNVQFLWNDKFFTAETWSQWSAEKDNQVPHPSKVLLSFLAIFLMRSQWEDNQEIYHCICNVRGGLSNVMNLPGPKKLLIQWTLHSPAMFYLDFRAAGRQAEFFFALGCGPALVDVGCLCVELPRYAAPLPRTFTALTPQIPSAYYG